MGHSIIGKGALLAGLAATALLTSACAGGSSAGSGSPLPQVSATISPTSPGTAQAGNFPSGLIQTPPESTATSRSVQLIEPMYSAIMNVSTGLDQTGVFDFYTTTLTEAGFEKVADRPLADAVGIGFSRGEEKIDVIFGVGSSGAFSVVASLNAASVS